VVAPVFESAQDRHPTLIFQQAIGDIHGNLKQLRCCLLAAHLIDEDDDDHWKGGNSVLVQVGDVLDRGESELECLSLLCKLARQAPEAGGIVVLMWGNHEVSGGVPTAETIEWLISSSIHLLYFVGTQRHGQLCVCQRLRQKMGERI